MYLPLRRRAAAACARLVLLTLLTQGTLAQVTPAPPRAEGEGPFDRLVLRGGTLIDGTGAPPIGPVDIVIDQNRITRITVVGYPNLPIRESRRPEKGDFELDVSGMYILPGFVDAHAHIGGSSQGTPAEYVFKLWMGHGVTTIRDPGSMNGLEWTLEHRQKSAENQITAPRIKAYLTYGAGKHDIDASTPDGARRWVRWLHKAGGDGIKFFGLPPDVFEAALDEAGRLGLGSTAHHAQMSVSRANVLHTARWGLGSMDHWYGLPEALFTDRTIQDYPADYNYQDEQHRFGQAGQLWKQAAQPDSERWNAVIDELVGRDFTIVPSLTIYEASRDLMRAMRAEWHDEYTLPSLWRFFTPSREAHGSYWFYWTTRDEIEWKNNYRIWMRFLNDYKNRGGRIAAGSDSGFIYKLYGFDFIRELELLQEAGFHPLEVIWSATQKGAETLGLDDRLGTIQTGKLADLIVVDENPLENFKVLYGTGAIRLNKETNRVERAGSVKYTIKDGIVYDARQLLADVRRIVAAARSAESARVGTPVSEEVPPDESAPAHPRDNAGREP